MIHQYTIQGVTCEACAAKVKNTLASMEGVEDVDVNLHNALATVHPIRSCINAMGPYFSN